MMDTQHLDKVAISILTKELSEVKAERDLFLLQLKELDEAMDDSKIVIKQGSLYHLSIKRVIKEAE